MEHQISLAEAIDLTTRYRNNPLTDLPLCETFDKTSVTALLAQAGSHSLRIYLGRKEDDSVCSVLVAADAEGQDILPAPQLSAPADEDEGIILEDAFRCPPACPPPSPLNE
jgi:hypothetical protein